MSRRWPPVALAVGLVLVLDPWTVQVFSLPKWWILAVGVPGALVLVRHQRSSVPLALPWLAFLAAIAISTAASIAPLLSVSGGPYRFQGAITWGLWFGCFVLGASALRARPVLMDTLSLLVAANGVVAVAQRLGIDPFDIQSGLDRTRAWGTFGNAAVLGGFAAVVLPISLCQLRSARARPLVAWLGLTGAVTCLAAAGARGPILGAVAALLMIGLTNVDARRAAAGTGAVLLIAVLATPGTTDRVVGSSSLAASTAAGRVAQWTLTTELLADRPLVGSGLETYRLRFPAVVDDDFERRHGGDVVHDRAHNIVLDLGVTTGLAGVAAFGWLVVAVARAFAARRHEPDVVAIGAAALAHLVALQFGVQDVAVDAIVWLLVGTALALPDRTVEPRRTLARLVTTAAAGSAVVALTIWATRDVIADHRLDAALRSSPPSGQRAEDAAAVAPERPLYAQAAGRIAVEEGRFDDAIEHFDDALAVAHGDVELLLDRARALALRALVAGAPLEPVLAEYEAVVERVQPSSGRAWLGYGIVLAESGRLDDAVRAWTRASELRPSDPDPLRNLGAAAELQGRSADAVEHFEGVLHLVPTDPEAIAALERLSR